MRARVAMLPLSIYPETAQPFCISNFFDRSYFRPIFFSRFSYLNNVKFKTWISGNSSNFLGNFATFSQRLWYWKLYSWEGCFQFPFSWFHCLINVKLKTETFFLYLNNYVPFLSLTFLNRKTDLISSIKTSMEFKRLAEDERIFNLFSFRDHFVCLARPRLFSFQHPVPYFSLIF